MYHPITCLKALKKRMNPLSKNSKLSGQELHPISAEQEAKLLTIQLKQSVNVPLRPNAKYSNSPE
jgi:hypothetical protein